MTLWREVQNDMFKLWCLAEDDLLDPDNYYSLRDTGQVNINTRATENVKLDISPWP